SDSHRLWSELPGTRRSASNRGVGVDAGICPVAGANSLVGRGLSGHRDRDCGARDQSRRRRTSRCSRPEGTPLNGSRLSVRDLTAEFTGRTMVRAIDGISLDIAAGETVGLVGESGSGKSVTALSILKLLPTANAVVRRGEIWFEGRDLLQMKRGELRAIRGND